MSAASRERCPANDSSNGFGGGIYSREKRWKTPENRCALDPTGVTRDVARTSIGAQSSCCWPGPHRGGATFAHRQGLTGCEMVAHMQQMMTDSSPGNLHERELEFTFREARQLHEVAQ